MSSLPPPSGFGTALGNLSADDSPAILHHPQSPAGARRSHVQPRAGQIVRELPLALYDPRASDGATFDYFDRMPRYRDPIDQRAGLQPFEARALRGLFPPAPARGLAHGVGGGARALGPWSRRATRSKPLSPPPGWPRRRPSCWVAAPRSRSSGCRPGPKRGRRARSKRS